MFSSFCVPYWSEISILCEHFSMVYNAVIGRGTALLNLRSSGAVRCYGIQGDCTRIKQGAVLFERGSAFSTAQFAWLQESFNPKNTKFVNVFSQFRFLQGDIDVAGSWLVCFRLFCCVFSELKRLRADRAFRFVLLFLRLVATSQTALCLQKRLNFEWKNLQLGVMGAKDQGKLFKFRLVYAKILFLRKRMIEFVTSWVERHVLPTIQSIIFAIFDSISTIVRYEKGQFSSLYMRRFVIFFVVVLNYRKLIGHMAYFAPAAGVKFLFLNKYCNRRSGLYYATYCSVCYYILYEGEGSSLFSICR